MPKLTRKTPCAGCPFKRDSAPGWLGADTPENFVKAALADYVDQPLPCHLAIDYDDPNWLETQYPDAPYCAGALIFCKNNCKSPHDPEQAALVREVERDKQVFSWPQEFLAHHKGEGDE